MISARFKVGGSLIGVLLALVMFSLIVISLTHWQQGQNYQRAVIFQRQQALLIAHNQTVRLRLKLGCERNLHINKVAFDILCQEANITVRYPLGEVRLSE